MTRKGPGCNVCSVLAAMPETDRETLIEAMDDATFTSAAIARALKEEGYNHINANSIIRHRRSDCARRDASQ